MSYPVFTVSILSSDSEGLYYKIAEELQVGEYKIHRGVLTKSSLKITVFGKKAALFIFRRYPTAEIIKETLTQKKRGDVPRPEFESEPGGSFDTNLDESFKILNDPIQVY